MLDVCDGGEEIGHDDLVGVLGPLVHSDHESGGAHGVADVVELLVHRVGQDLVDHGRDVVLAVVVPTGLEKVYFEDPPW